jgi:hypothetical protein
MKKYTIIISAFFVIFCHIAKAQEQKVLVIINTSIYSDLKTEILRYVDDISPEYRVELFETSGGSAEDLKNFIKSQRDSLVGCILIGSMPSCRFEIENDLAAAGRSEFPCDLFFMDLDGSWADLDGNGIYDSHTEGTGDMAPEIFIGRIDASLFSPYGDKQVDDLRKYFNRDHNYWSSAYGFRKTGLAYTDVDWKDYTPINEEMKYLYGDNNFQLIRDDRISKKDYIENRLLNEQYEFIQVAGHAIQYIQWFNFRGGLNSDEIRNIAPKALGYNLFACSACDYTYYNFMGGAYIFSNSDKSLVVIGSTKTGSMLQFYAFYKPLGENKSIGMAYREWFEYLAPYDDYEKSWHYGMTIIGDPLIKFNSGSGNHGPLLDAGSPQRILWPDSTLQLNATVQDDGLPSGSQLEPKWELVSGPGNVAFTDMNGMSTSATLKNPGDYKIKISASDSEFTGEDFVDIKIGHVKWKGETESKLLGMRMGLAVRDSLAYLSTNWNLNIINVADKTNPCLINSLEYQESPGYPYYNNLYLDSNFAYIVLSEKGLHIFNIQDCYNIYQTGSFSTHDSLEKANDIKVIGDYAYVADNVRGLMILDVHDRADPKLTGYCPTNGTADALSIQGDYAYIADGPEGMKIIDISDKSHPKETGSFNDSFDHTYFRQGIQVVGNYAYVSYNDYDRFCCISIIDISDKTKPFEVSHLNRYYKGFYVEGNYLYSFFDVLGIYDITDKSNPVLIESYINEEHYFQEVMNIFKSGQYIYIVDNLNVNGLNILQLGLDNTCPYVYAGEDLKSYKKTTPISGMESDDHLPEGSALSFSWQKISGPGQVSFINPFKASTAVYFSDTGTYVLRLSVFDGDLTGYDDVRITCKNAPPKSRNAEVCEGDSIPGLIASGDTIHWYNDSLLTELIHTGDTLVTGKISAGLYTYYVTQTISGYESLPDTVFLSVKSKASIPVSKNVAICEGQSVPDLNATGENIRWYGDSVLTELLHSGNSYIPDKPSIGKNIFYVTQTVADCESDYNKVELSVNRLPSIILGEDTTITRDQHIILGPYGNSYIYLWNDGSVNPYYDISANDIGPGLHIFSVEITDTNTCRYSDSLSVQVAFPTNTGNAWTGNELIVYPNPADKLLNIKISDFHAEDILVKLYNQEGELLKNTVTNTDNEGNIMPINISGLPPGIYYLKIISQTKQFMGKVIIK